jgi:hypothetical protein
MLAQAIAKLMWTDKMFLIEISAELAEQGGDFSFFEGMI